MPERFIEGAELALNKAAKILSILSATKATREWDEVFSTIQAVDWDVVREPVVPSVFLRPRTWSDHAGGVILGVASRFTASAKKETVLEAFIQFVSTEKPPRDSLVNFVDATMKFHAEGQMTQESKSPDNNVYINIPVSLEYEPSEENFLKLRRAFATMFAGNADGRRADLCADALVFYGGLFPHRILVFTGAGGDGKSLRTSLRKTTFKESFGFLSPSCFNVPEEFRKQAGQVAHMSIVTIQE